MTRLKKIGSGIAIVAKKAPGSHIAGNRISRMWRRFKILDRYIMGKFLGTYVFAIALILAITVMFDINEKLDAFLKAPLKATIFDYFMNFLPYFANQFSPLFTFIAVIFFTSKLAGNSEIIAMLSSGVSYKRLLRPYLASAAVIALVTFVLSAYVIPPANVKRIEFTNTYVKNKRVDYGSNIMLQVAPGQIAYMTRYDNNLRTGYKFSLESFKDKQLVSRLTSQSIKWDTLILTVIGMSLSSKKVRGGMGLNIGIGLALSFSYILFMTVTSTFAVSGLTSPMVAMWIPNIIYTIVAIALYRRASGGR